MQKDYEEKKLKASLLENQNDSAVRPSAPPCYTKEQLVQPGSEVVRGINSMSSGVDSPGGVAHTVTAVPVTVNSQVDAQAETYSEKREQNELLRSQAETGAWHTFNICCCFISVSTVIAGIVLAAIYFKPSQYDDGDSKCDGSFVDLILPSIPANDGLSFNLAAIECGYIEQPSSQVLNPGDSWRVHYPDVDDDCQYYAVTSTDVYINGVWDNSAWVVTSNPLSDGFSGDTSSHSSGTIGLTQVDDCSLEMSYNNVATSKTELDSEHNNLRGLVSTKSALFSMPTIVDKSGGMHYPSPN